MLVTDHTQANNELMALAKQKGVKINAKVKPMAMSKDNFDSAFLTEAMKDHEKDIAAFEKEAKSGKDPETKAWAKKMLPTLKKHLKAVKKAHERLDEEGRLNARRLKIQNAARRFGVPRFFLGAMPALNRRAGLRC